MLLADEQNIREVIMFLMNQRAEDLMMGAPSEPTRTNSLRPAARPAQGIRHKGRLRGVLPEDSFEDKRELTFSARFMR